MRKQRTISQYTTIKHHNQKHCPQDLTCNSCCLCVDQLKLQNKILKEKLVASIKQKQDAQKVAFRLTKELKEWLKKKEEFDNLDQFKKQIRKLMKKQLEDQKKAEDFIIQEKLEHFKQEKANLKHANQELSDQLNQSKAKLLEIHISLSNSQQKIRSLQRQLTNLRHQTQNHTAKLKELTQKSNIYEAAVQEKTSIITRLQQALSKIEQNYTLQKVKAVNNGFESLQSQQQLKAKLIQIQSLQKSAQQKKTSIDHLTGQKQKLDKLVKELDSTIHSYSELSHNLRQRLLISQDYALQKQIEYKKLQIDFYDTVYK